MHRGPDRLDPALDAAAPAPQPDTPTAPAAPTPPATPGLDEASLRHLGPIRRFFARHPRVMDVVVMVWFGVPALGSALTLGVTAANPEMSSTGHSMDPALSHVVLIAVVAAVLGTVTLWWRRSRPVTVLVIVTLLGAFTALATHSTIGLEYAAAFALYAVAARYGPRWAWPCLVAAVLVLGPPTVLTGTSELVVTSGTGQGDLSTGGARFLLAVLIVVPGLLAVTIGLSVFNRRRYVNSLVDRANRLALERDQREQLAVAGERVRIARELHDVVAHSLTVMITLSEGAAQIAPRDAERAGEVMREVAETGRTALTDTRRVVGVLRTERPDSLSPEASATAPLAPAPTHALEHLVSLFRGAGLPVTLTVAGPRLPEDAALRLAIYRIAQEALTNVLRYAPSTPGIELRLTRSAEEIVVSVHNGAALEAPPATVTGSGRGLIGMRERVAVFGGTLTAGPTAEGWAVEARLPWRDDGRVIAPHDGATSLPNDPTAVAPPVSIPKDRP